MITMSTAPKLQAQKAEQERSSDAIEEAIRTHLMSTQIGRYKIVYDVPSENMQPLFDVLSSSGWKLNSVVPGVVSHIGSFYPAQFIFERKGWRVIEWSSPSWLPLLLGLLCLIALLFCR